MVTETKLLKPIRNNGAPPKDPAERQQGTSPLDLGNRLLMLLSVILAGHVVIHTIPFSGNDTASPAGLRRAAALANRTDGADSSESDKMPALSRSHTKPFNIYQRSLEQRNVFQAPWEHPSLGSSIVPDAAAEQLMQLRLVGILLDNNPKAIFENGTTRETLFLSQGEKFGEAVLEDIQEGKAIFRYKGQKVELTP